MPDGTLPFPAHQRSHGLARLGLSAGRITALSQAGSPKVFLPRVHSAVPEAVFLNTSGGLTGGDDLGFCIDLGPGQHLTATTQTAERAYASTSGAARMTLRATLAPGAHLDWMPQETILFQHSDLDRDTQIDLAGDASCLMLETLVLGRHAMQETTINAHLRDTRCVRRDGHPVWAETLLLAPETLHPPRAALLGENRALAVLALVGAGADSALSRLRALPEMSGVTAAASAFDGKCLLRAVARDALPLRHYLTRALQTLRPAQALPRVWQV